MATAGHGSKLLEREAELAALDAAMTAAEDRTGGLVVVLGPPGIGKTRLVDAARRRAADRGLTVLSARGSELEGGFAFGAVRQLFEPAVAADPDPAALLAGAAELARGLVVPTAVAQAPQGTSFATLHGLYWLTVNLADRGPLLIAVDDAQWLDAPSLRFLAFLAVRLEGVAVAVVVASRDADLDPARPLDALLAEPRAHLVRPAPLSLEGVTGIVRAAYGAAATDGLCAACLAATRGNPFLLGELLAELRRRPSRLEGTGTEISELRPPRIAGAVLSRLRALAPEATTLARAVAVLGDRVDLRRAALLAGLDLDAAGTAADALAEAAVLEPELPLHFAHPLVRTAVYEDMPASERAAEHQRAARMLHGEGERGAPVALQLLSAPPLDEPWAVAALRAAARAALAQGAPDEAERFLRRARAEAGAEAADGLRFELGAAAALARAPDALALLRSAFETERAPAIRTAAAVECAGQLFFSGRAEEAVDVLEQAAPIAAEAGPEAQGMLDGFILVAAEQSLPARRRVAGRLQAAVAASASGAGLPLPVLVIAALERAMAGGTGEEVVTLAHRAIGGGRLLAEQTADSPFIPIVAGALIVGGRAWEAEDLLSVALAEGRSRGSPTAIALASAVRAWTRVRRGALREAEADARTCIALNGEGRWADVVQPIAVGALVEALVELGAPEEAEHEARLLDPAEQPPGAILAQRVREARMRLRLAREDPRGALHDMEACATWERDWGATNGTWLAWRPLGALAYARLGDTGRARALAEEELSLARRFGAERALGVALRTVAEVGPDDGGALALLRESERVLAEAGAPLEEVRTRMALGGTLLARGDAKEARERLRAALDAAHRCGARALEEQVRAELVAAGGRPQRVAATGWAALTPAEQRIARMAAEGLSNRGIAQALFVTAKTVETHLSSAYRKLDIGSRSQLADRLPPGAGQGEPGDEARPLAAAAGDLEVAAERGDAADQAG